MNDRNSKWGCDWVKQMNCPRRGVEAGLVILTNGLVATKAQASGCITLTGLVTGTTPSDWRILPLSSNPCTKTKLITVIKLEAILLGFAPLMDTSTDSHKIRKGCRNSQCQLILSGNSFWRYVTPLLFLHSHGLPKWLVISVSYKDKGKSSP